MKLNLKIHEKLSVMIVDDDEGVRDVLTASLETFGIFTSIIIARNGSEAFVKYNNQNFDLVITDIMMPISDGLDLLQNIQKTNRDSVKQSETVLMVMSGMITVKEAERVKRLGIKHTIVKPFTIEYLRDKISEVLLKYKKDKFV